MLKKSFHKIGFGVVFIMAMMLSNNLKATHIVGGELTYTCLDEATNLYEVKLTVYRDCFNGASDAPFDDPATIGIFNGTSGFLYEKLSLPLTAVNDTIQPVIADTCLFIPPSVCVHTTFYTGTVNLPDNGVGYTLAYQRCCRNVTILNIVNPLETGATFTSFVSPLALSECNTQATFDDWPPIFICVNEPIDYSSSASDADGDSLVYKLCTPFVGGSLTIPQPSTPSGPPYTGVTWNSPVYGVSNMLGGQNPMTIDPNTGFITGIPPSIGQFVVGVCVEEYRNGVLIAETKRDFQYNVGQCGIVESIIGNENVLCDNLTITFDNQSTNATEFIWDFGDPNNPGTTNEFEPTFTFSDVGTYTITLISEPNSECTDTLEFELVVKESTLTVDFNAHAYSCENGDLLVELEDFSFDTENDINSWFWEVSDGQTSTDEFPYFLVDGALSPFTISLTTTATDGCAKTITKTVPFTPDPIGTLGDPITICLGGSAELFPDHITGSPLIYTWSPTTGLSNPNISNPIGNPSVTTTYTISITDPNNLCTATVQKQVIVSDYTDLEITAVITDADGNETTVSGQDEVITCEESTITLSTTTTNTTGTSSVTWYDANGNVLSSSTELTINPDGSTTYRVVVMDDNGCTGEAEVTVNPATVNINIEELVNTGGGSGITDIDGDGTLDLCLNETSFLTLNNLDPMDNLTYSWTAAPGIITAGADTASPTIFGVSEGVFTLTVTATNQFNCSASVEVDVQVHNVSELNIQAIITDLTDNSTTTISDQDEIVNCTMNSSIMLTETSTNTSGTTTIVWTDANGQVLGSGNPLNVPPTGTFTYTVTVTDQFGCSATKDITVVGNPVDVTVLEVETIGGGSGLTDIDGDGDFDLCLGETTSLTVQNNNPSDILTYNWTGDDQIIVAGGDSNNPSIMPSTAGIYTLILITENQYACSSETQIIIDVHELPAIDISADVINEQTGMTETISGEDVITNCAGTDIVLNTETTTVISSDITITWLSNGTPIGSGNNITVNADGSTTYTLLLTDAFGCENSTDITVQGNPVDVVIVETSTDNDGDGHPDLDVNGDGSLDLCAGQNYDFTINNQNPNDILTYEWTGDAIIVAGSDSATPTINAAPGDYTITVIVTNQYGCTYTQDVAITAADTNPDLSVTTSQDCGGFTLAFTSNNASSDYYVWDFGDGSTPLTGVQSPSHTYPSEGIYTLTITPLAGLPCVLPSFSQNIEVAESLINIAFDYEYVDCSATATSIQFTDMTVPQVGTITGWEWQFSDGQSSDQQNPLITISQDINLTATLIVTNSADCDGSAVQNIQVNLFEDPGILDEVIACPNEGPVSLNPNGNPLYDYVWSPSTGLNSATDANPSANPSETTVYFVTVTDNTGGGICVIETQVEVIVPPAIDINVNADGSTSGVFTIDNSSDSNTITTCEEESVTITTSTTTGTTAGFDIEWTDGDGNPIGNLGSITLQPGVTETYTITYTDVFGCSETRMITLEGGPVDIEIEEDEITETDGTGIGGILTDGFLELCLGQSYEITVNNLDPNDILTYAWTGDVNIISSGVNASNPVVNPSAAGTYILNLTTTNQYGCDQIDQITVNVIDANAVLSFEEVKDCNGVTVLFTNTSSGDNDDYLWNFGDPNSLDNTSTDVNPEHTYPGVGSYQVALGLETNVTCVDDFNQQVDIVAPILASDFTYEYLDCDENGVTIQFTEQTTNPQSNTTGFFWDFGNGETSIATSPQLILAEDTDLIVTLTVYTALDCESISQAQEIIVSVIDDIQELDPVLACQNDGPKILDLNADPSYTYEWSPAAGLDDPSSPAPTADPGQTTVYSVTITDNSGSLPCSVIREVEVFVPETIELEIPDSFNTDCTNFADITVVGNIPDLTYEWQDEDGNVISTGPDLSVTDLSGDHVFTVIATDANGCEEPQSLTITGTQLDVTIDDLQYLCLDENGELTVVNNGDPNDILTINWTGPNILSGANTANPIIQTNMPTQGIYTVEVTNQYGCSQIQDVEVVVLDTAEPAINFGQCEGTTINFFNNSPSATFYTWDFGDGNTSTDPNPAHTYDAPGDYIVTLTLPDGTSCNDEISLDLMVDDMPDFDAAFNFNYDVCDSTGLISFTDATVSTNQGEIISWSWVFDPGNTSANQNTEIMVGDNENIMVTFTVLTDAGCESEITQNIPITLIDTQVDLGDELQCIDLVANLNDNPNTNYEYEWSPSVGLSDPNSPNPTIIAGSTTEYTVTITDANQNGCTSVQTMTLEVPPRIEMETEEDQIFCEEMEVDLFASSDVSSTQFDWSLEPDFNNIIATGEEILAETGRPNIYYVLATDEFGCTETAAIEVANYEVLVEPLSPVKVCLENELELQLVNQLSGTDTLSFVWTGPDILVGTETSPNPEVNPEVTTDYTAVVTNQHGCVLVDTVTVEVIDMDNLITEVTPTEDTIYIGNETQIEVTEGDFDYQWSPTDGLSDPNIANPIASPMEDTEYTLTITDPNGCSTIRTVTIIVLSRACDEPFIFFPNAFSPNNDGENDMLKLRANENFVTDINWIVYNRWGEKVFEGNNLTDEWDGYFKGELVQPDVYGYCLRVTCTDGEEFVKRGNISILR